MFISFCWQNKNKIIGYNNCKQPFCKISSIQIAIKFNLNLIALWLQLVSTIT